MAFCTAWVLLLKSANFERKATKKLVQSNKKLPWSIFLGLWGSIKLKEGSSSSQLYIQDSLQEVDFSSLGSDRKMRESSEQRHKPDCISWTSYKKWDGMSQEMAQKQQRWLSCKSWPRQKEIPFLQPNSGSVLAINVTPAGKWHCWRHNVAKVIIPKCLGRELGELKVTLVKYFQFQ